MSVALEIIPNHLPSAPAPALQLPWRDPHTVSAGELAGVIARLERASAENPDSADLRTCLGMAYALNYDAYKAMDALEAARGLDSGHFFAQFKYAELHYRLRALERAEVETQQALRLARDGCELALARRQLQEIRRLRREGTQKPAWTKSLLSPVLGLLLLFALASLVMVLR